MIWIIPDLPLHLSRHVLQNIFSPFFSSSVFYSFLFSYLSLIFLFFSCSSLYHFRCIWLSCAVVDCWIFCDTCVSVSLWLEFDHITLYLVFIYMFICILIFCGEDSWYANLHLVLTFCGDPVTTIKYSKLKNWMIIQHLISFPFNQAMLDHKALKSEKKSK